MTFPYKAVLVLGATSGIGLALAEKMIQNGCHVIGVGRRQERLDEFVQKYGKDKASSVRFDITNLAGIPSFVEEFVKSTLLIWPFTNNPFSESQKFTQNSTVYFSTLESNDRLTSRNPNQST
jgi:NADP-dependent 3-hydroxy acid dehydrogenase YdfG